MSRTAKSIFLETISYDPKTFMCYPDTRIEEDIILEIDDDGEGPAYYDKKHFLSTGKHLIHINNTHRLTKEMLFDFYHELAKILYDKNLISSQPVKDWLKDNDEFCSIINEDLIIDMVCDMNAAERLRYDFTVARMIPLKKINLEKGKHPDATDQELKIYVQSTNNLLTIRRKFLDYIQFENIQSVPRKKLAFEYVPLGGSSKRGLTRSQVFNIVKELAEGCGIDTEPEKIRPLSTLQLVMSKMRIAFDNKETFQPLIERMIKAINGTAPNSVFDIRSKMYVNVKTKPENWDKVYHKYYRYDNQTKQFVYIDKTVNENGETEIPFGDNVYTKEKVNVTVAIKKIQDKYHRLINEFLIPQYKRYTNMVHITDRNAQQYMIEQVLVRHLEGDLPTYSEIESLKNEYRGVNNISDPAIKKATTGLLSYKDKVEIAKNKYPIQTDESFKDYEDRIHRIIMKRIV